MGLFRSKSSTHLPSGPSCCGAVEARYFRGSKVSGQVPFLCLCADARLQIRRLRTRRASKNTPSVFCPDDSAVCWVHFMEVRLEHSLRGSPEPSFVVPADQPG